MTPLRLVRHGSIARTLTAMNMLVSGAALALACLGFAVYEFVTFRQAMVRTLSLEAQITGSNSVSAILFNDPQSAERTLSALRAAPNIMSAEIRAPDGRVLAAYRRDGAAGRMAAVALSPGAVELSQIDRSGITLARRILFEGKPTGIVYIRSDLEELYDRLRRYGVIVTAVLLASLVAALTVSRMSQRAITQPLGQLAGVARRVSHDKDYSVRASVAGSGEVAVLIDAFNEMLAEIQHRDRSLQEARDQLEDRVNQRTLELTAVNSELEAFSYSVSHDLRAPVRHITGFAGLLQAHAGASLDERGRAHLGKIIGAANSMGRLIDDLIAFSRMGRSTLVTRRVNLEALVHEVQAEVMAETGDRSITWRVHALPEVKADPGLLRSVLGNLLSNAVKYTGTREEAHIEVGTVPSLAGDVVVFVRDNGVGFDMQYMDKLFGVFQRLHGADEFSGSGIGLATVRRIVERHGGRTWADGRLNEGATFYFSLPAADLPRT